jgi:hypothetical protein
VLRGEMSETKMKKITFKVDEDAWKTLEKGPQFSVTYEVIDKIFELVIQELRKRDVLEVDISESSISLKDEAGEIIEVKKEKAFYVRDDRDIKLE